MDGLSCPFTSFSSRFLNFTVARFSRCRYFAGHGSGRPDFFQGSIMRVNLTEEDKRAIDLLLDQGLSADATSSGRTGYAAPAIDDIRARLRKASSVLSLLQHLPVAEPPADLVARTMRLIDDPENASEGRFVPPNAPFFDANRPMA
jgi:hypothetical protein